MKEELKTMIICLLQEKITVISWGITDIQITDTNLIFKANGLKHKGIVDIGIHKDGYQIKINDKSYICTIDNIVRTLDRLIEHTDNYISDIEDIIKKRIE